LWRTCSSREFIERKFAGGSELRVLYTIVLPPNISIGAPPMKQKIAGRASLAINKLSDWSRRTFSRSKNWFEEQRLKYYERPLMRKPQRLEDEEGPGRFKRFWYAFVMAKRFYPSTQTPPVSQSSASSAAADITD